MSAPANLDLSELARQIKLWGQSLGFQQVAISQPDLHQAEQHLHSWLNKGFHGDMHYMSAHGLKRSRPSLLVDNTRSIISVRMDYLYREPATETQTLNHPEAAIISRYALGRDYHKVLRQRLQQLAIQIETAIGPFGYRAFVDSAPVLEKAIAEQAGLGWIGKHSNLINRHNGSWFFLGELYTDLVLPTDSPASNHCGSCQSCLEKCPTGAIVAPYQVDARLCISYLTIEYGGSIPLELRPLMGQRIYGCDDCLLACPWNRFAKLTREADFKPRNQLDAISLLTVFSWSETEFLKHTEGSAIRRIGHLRWRRNIAVALGNGPAQPEVLYALQQALPDSPELLAEHIQWAIDRISSRSHDAVAKF